MINFKLVYNRKKGAKRNNETAIIEIRATLRGARTQKYYSTKIKVTPLEWNEKDKRVIKNKDADNHNYYLDKYINELKHLQYEKDFKKQPFTFEDVKAYFKQKKEVTSSFISFVNAEIDTDLSVKPKTKAQHRNTINILKDFTKEDILFSDLNYAFLDKFINHLRELEYQQNTIHKHHKNLKKFIDLACTIYWRHSL
jgi:hypothetical protein